MKELLKEIGQEIVTYLDKWVEFMDLVFPESPQ